MVRGQVEVADFKSGQIAQVMAGQHATAFASGKTGLSLGGTGHLRPDRARQAARAVGRARSGAARSCFTAIRHATEWTGASSRRGMQACSPQGMACTRISSSIGEVRLNVHKRHPRPRRDKSAVHRRPREAPPTRDDLGLRPARRGDTAQRRSSRAACQRRSGSRQQRGVSQHGCAVSGQRRQQRQRRR